MKKRCESTCVARLGNGFCKLPFDCSNVVFFLAGHQQLNQRLLLNKTAFEGPQLVDFVLRASRPATLHI